MSEIAEALAKRFVDHRVIFWIDEKQELQEQFTELNLEAVEKIQWDNNEFEIKYKINKQSLESKFLIYRHGPTPANEQNWLLDMELAHYTFHTDREAMYLQELGLGYHLKELIKEHMEFFRAAERRQAFKELLGDGDELQALRYKMLAVLFDTENISLVSFIHAHGTAFVQGNDRIDKGLERFNLKKYYWSEIARKYNYQNESPSIYDFLLEVFDNNFVLGKRKALNKETRLLLSIWKDSLRYQQSFSQLSERISGDLDVESSLSNALIEDLLQDDLFKLTDYRVIHELVNLISTDQISNNKVQQYVKQRENKFWFDEFEPLYQSLLHASEMIGLVSKFANSEFRSMLQGVNDYATSFFLIDQLYRKFIWSYRQSGQNRVLARLAEKVEKVYSNDWLLQIGNKWQHVIDGLTQWPNREFNSQARFFTNHVLPFIEKNQRLFVIISDALRYECGEELTRRLQAEKRYEATLEHMISTLPSYTQLGMAALLPHKTLTIQEGTDSVLVDGMSSQGIQGRSKVLAENSTVRATAITAEELMKLNAMTTGREFVKQYDLIYIYHNRIDKVGDDKTSEDKVFEAVEDEMGSLMDLLRKISNMNGSNMIITSDHGFLYQHRELDESDFSVSNHQGTIWKENRRFIIGKALTGDKATRHFNGEELQLQPDVDVLIPKSINRLRVKGAGSRFIHGGATLQEIVIPLIRISKTRQDTTSQVEIDIIKSTDRITTNILAVSYIQADLVSEKVLPRVIQSYIQAEDGEVLSDKYTYNFDIDEGSERQREVKHRFQLSSKASGKYKNQRVSLILEEPVEGSTKWKEYKRYFYSLNISFTNDFDF